MNASDLWPLALRLLARRGHSVAELERKLKERGYSAAQIAPVIERCRELGYLDDSRFPRTGRTEEQKVSYGPARRR